MRRRPGCIRVTGHLAPILRVLALAGPFLLASAGLGQETVRPPSPSTYRPHGFSRRDLERYRLLSVDSSKVSRDGRRSGIPLRELSGLPEHCWAIEYVFVWSDEPPSPGHKAGTPDPEPVIVFVSDDGAVAGVQSRAHYQWLPINTALSPVDFVDRTHVMVGFAPNVHTPGAGLLHTLLALGVGNLPADVAATVRLLEDLVKRGIVHDGGH